MTPGGAASVRRLRTGSGRSPGNGGRAGRGRLRAALAFAGATLPIVVGLSGTAGASDNGPWSVLPVANTVGQRPCFYLAAAPSQSVADAVTLTNRGDRPRTFRLYAADAYNTARDGGFALRGPDEPRLATAAWAKLDRERVTVAARASVAVGFTVTVPERAEPGTIPAPSWPWRNGPPPRPAPAGGSAYSRPSPPGCTCG